MRVRSGSTCARDSDRRRRRSASARSAGQLGKPYSRATASWAADSVTRSDTAEPGEGIGLATGGGAKQLSCLAAKLVKVGAAGKLAGPVA
jgi:hypothetical protein